MFDLEKLLVDVFDPQPGELVTVVMDLPHEGVDDTPDWKSRREMAEGWRQALEKLGERRKFKVQPILAFEATGANNADLPARAKVGDEEVDLREAMLESTLVIAMTQFSATAPLYGLSEEKKDFRAASMPGVLQRMEKSALSADYSVVARRCQAIAEAMKGAILCDVEFSTGHRCWFDLRNRKAEVDDGYLPRFKHGERIINLPSGETFIVPYEGEIEGQPSWTAGTIPLERDGEPMVLHLAGNRIQLVEGNGPAAEEFAEFLAEDPARANVAEVAFGVNDKAEVTGIVLEDEKAGFHWAFGRSEHLGGVTGPDAFRSPETIVHQDIVYAEGNPVQVRRAFVIHPDGRVVDVIRDGQYVL